MCLHRALHGLPRHPRRGRRSFRVTRLTLVMMLCSVRNGRALRRRIMTMLTDFRAEYLGRQARGPRLRARAMLYFGPRTSRGGLRLLRRIAPVRLPMRSTVVLRVNGILYGRTRFRPT